MSDREVDKPFVKDVEGSPANAVIVLERKRRRIFLLQRKSDLLKQLEDLDGELELIQKLEKKT